jgi:hypothetical protein
LEGAQASDGFALVELDPRECCFFESDEVGLHDLNVISIAVQDTSS